jgi:nucleoside-diphosphate kinase
MVKPDVVERGLYGDIISVVLHRGFNVTNLRMLSMDQAMAERFYEVHKEREFFPALVDYITSGPVVAIEIEGDGVVERVRDLIGVTDPANSSKGTIRHMYGRSLQNNAVHASDAPESAKKELAIVFGGS